MKKVILLSIVIFSLVIVCSDVSAQCAMCRATVESNINDSPDQAVGAGLNKGILYLMAIPYILFSVVAFVWYRSSRANAKKNSQVAA